ncbi:hypothetical protein BH20ACT2_BH20ACT2_24360 [soil metagenome]
MQLAVALLHRPELLLLDEPFSGLDPLGVQVMVGVLRSHADAGGAVVFSSHQLDLVEGMCDAVAVIHRGRAVLTGPVEEVRSRGPRRLVIGVASEAPWRPALPGVAVEADDQDGVRVRLEPGADEDALLAEAQRAGRLTHLSVYRPSLAELFREAVGMTPADAEAQAAAEAEAADDAADARPSPGTERPLDRVGR